MAINPISQQSFLNRIDYKPAETKPNEKAAEGKTTFGEILGKSLDEIDGNISSTSNSIEKLVSGKDVDIHEFILQTEKTAATVNLTMQVRNKIVDAYKEIMRMQL
jgi:flagellar hook-basal body complex protein FliE